MAGGIMSPSSNISRAIGLSSALALAALVAACMPRQVAAEDCQLIDKAGGRPFAVFQIMGYRNIPDLGSHCIQRLKIWYGHEFWPGGVPRKDDFDLGLPDRDRSTISRGGRPSSATSPCSTSSTGRSRTRPSRRLPSTIT
ncbi:MAG: hypothetical protein HC871_07700 [Rhizobiales bacterium]|nr:hypothetical protein [Hyphomicrobiales bacterium]